MRSDFSFNPEGSHPDFISIKNGLFYPNKKHTAVNSKESRACYPSIIKIPVL